MVYCTFTLHPNYKEVNTLNKCTGNTNDVRYFQLLLECCYSPRCRLFLQPPQTNFVIFNI